MGKTKRSQKKKTIIYLLQVNYILCFIIKGGCLMYSNNEIKVNFAHQRFYL